MSKFINNTAAPLAGDYVLPITRVGLYVAAGVVAGRKAIQGAATGVFALSSWVTDSLAIDKKIEPDSWRQWLHVNKDRFATMAKHNLSRDLAVAGGLATGGLVVEQAESFVVGRLKADDTVIAHMVKREPLKAASGALNKIWGAFTTPYHWWHGTDKALMQRVRDFRITPLKTSGWCGPECHETLDDYKAAPGKVYSYSTEKLSEGWAWAVHTGKAAPGKVYSYSTEKLSEGCTWAVHKGGDGLSWGVAKKGKIVDGFWRYEGMGVNSIASLWNSARDRIHKP